MSGGRPPYEPTPEKRILVKELAGFGVSQIQIARLAGCSDETLRLYYRNELDLGIAEAHAKVGRYLTTEATRNLGAAIFYAKTQMGWKEARDTPDDAPTLVIKITGGLIENPAPGDASKAQND